MKHLPVILTVFKWKHLFENSCHCNDTENILVGQRKQILDTVVDPFLSSEERAETEE